MNEYAKPLPEMSDDTKNYWEGCKRRQLLLPKCRACGKMFFFPHDFFPQCLSESLLPKKHR